jgi:hypothetical protein
MANLLVALLLAPWLALIAGPPALVPPASPTVRAAQASMDGPSFEKANAEPEGQMPDGVSRRVFPKCVLSDPHVTQAPETSPTRPAPGSENRQQRTIVSYDSRAPPASRRF